MRVLLDTHVLLWAGLEPERLPPKAQTLIGDPSNRLYFSAASIWELSIKAAAGKQNFKGDVPLLRRRLLGAGYIEVAITGDHALRTERLPMLHKDPFDRLIIAQALAQELVLITADRIVQRYPNLQLFSLDEA